MATVIGDEFFSDSCKIRIIDALHNHAHGDTHSHLFYEMVYVRTGFTLHSCEGEIEMLSAGNLFFIRPGEEHAYINAQQVKLYNCIFYGEALGDQLTELAKLPGLRELFIGEDTKSSDRSGAGHSEGTMQNRILRIDVGERRNVETMLEGIMREYDVRDTGWESSVKARLVLFLVRYSRLFAAQREKRREGSDDYYGYIYKVLEYVNEHYCEDVTMTELSAVTGLSPDYMARRFKAVMYMSPSEYVRKFRIAKAMEFLCNTSLSIAEIAAQTGFSNVSLFSRVFKTAVGLPPASYRKNIREDI